MLLAAEIHATLLIHAQFHFFAGVVIKLKRMQMMTTWCGIVYKFQV